MLEAFRRTANILQPLRIPAAIVAAISIFALGYMILTPPTPETRRFTIPSIVVLLWALNSYVFLTTFRGERIEAGESARLLQKVKTRLYKLWLGLIGILFVGLTVAATVLTLKLIGIWLKV